jgi:DNA-binding CsgD family transcriptional regulator/PAS domain-containing protein
MPPADTLLKLTERLYAAASEPAQWRPALEGVVDAFGAAHGTLDLYRPAQMDDSVVIGARIDPQQVARSRTIESMQAVASLFFAIPQGVSQRAQIISDQDFLRSEAYNDFIRPLGGFHSLNLRSNGGDRAMLLSLCRPQGAEGFSPDDAAALGLIAPHIMGAVALQYRLQTLELRHASLARVIDRMNAGVILTDTAGRPLLLNARAEKIVAEADGLIVDANGLAAATPMATRQLRDAIAAASRSTAIEQRLHLARPARRAPLLLSVLPVWRLGVELPGIAAPQVAIVIGEADAPSPIDRVAFGDTYRLTTRECEIAVLIGDGLDPQSVALQLGVGIGTVRHHLKHVFEKTGARNQTALVALLRGFVNLTG